MLVDTHCHLNHEQLSEDVTGAVERALSAGVRQMIVVGFDLPSSEEAARLAAGDPRLFAAVGIHPHDARHYDAAAEQRLRELGGSEGVIAIGEIGLDYHYDFSPREEQLSAFQAQLALATRRKLPVIIHCREAYDDVLDVLESDGTGLPACVMHCWAGDTRQAERSLDMGLTLGIGGVVTFKNAADLREIVAWAPLDRIVLETDAPYLAPMPYRGKRNEPAYVRLVAEKVAEIKGLSVEEVAAQTSETARRIFGLPSDSGKRAST